MLKNLMIQSLSSPNIILLYMKIDLEHINNNDNIVYIHKF